jgi:hypothetical protein
MQRSTISVIGLSYTKGSTLSGVTRWKLPVARFSAS